MRIRSAAFCVAAALCISGNSLSHETAEGQGRLGTVKFDNSCSAETKAELGRAIAMLHSFWETAGEETFRQVLAKDPQCTIASWGLASILMRNPLAGQGSSPKGAETAIAAIDAARKLGAKTQRERDYLDAVAAYYEDFANRPERERQLARAKAYEALAARYPDDDEAQIFAALYIAGTQTQTDATYAAYLKAAGILEKMFAKYPEHPGVAHYLIHSYDAGPIARQGMTAARKYAAIAPDAPHALHMPSHIFTRVGAWEESAATNERSATVAVKGKEIDEAYHASDYSVYAYLQLGRDTDARKTMDTVNQVPGYRPAVFIAPYAITSMPARIALERGAWAEAAKLRFEPTQFPFVNAIGYFARGLGAARSGDVAAAQREAEQLTGAHKALQEARNNFWANEVEVQRLALAGWTAKAQGNRDEALKLMRAAADLEDRTNKHIVTPGRLLPARELLGDMLFELGDPTGALKEYAQSQRMEPNRFRGLYGMALAAEAAGDRETARRAYNDLLAMAKGADASRTELTRARTYVAQK